MYTFKSIADFLKEYPALKYHPNLLLVDDNSFAASKWRHELCHFVEREADKAILKDFGFPKGFGEIFSLSFRDYKLVGHAKREFRVYALEKICPIYIENAQKSELSFNHSKLDSEMQKNLNSYIEEQRKIYTVDKFWNNFHERYALLQSSLLVGD